MKLSRCIAIIIWALFLNSHVTRAQNYITVNHNGIPTLYTSISAAISGSQNGDHIYLPGGTFSENITIDKELYIYGSGHYPDSTIATGVTKIIGTATIISGADNGMITGIYINGDFMFGTSDANEVVNNYTITRCRISSLKLSWDPGTGYSDSQNIVVEECVIDGSSSVGLDTLTLFEKNIFRGSIFHSRNLTYRNNIFLYSSSSGAALGGAYSGGENIYYCTFENNIIFDSYLPLSRCENSNFNNNIFVYDQLFPSGTNQGNNNIVNQPADSILVNYDLSGSFSYDHDYHLKSLSPGIGAGTDGFDIGIYGTAEPYKEGAVPSNPHIRSKSISVKNNIISVEIEVSAQDR